MDYKLFGRRFIEAVRVAHDFASKSVIENLPKEWKFRVYLNSSYDKNPLHPDERVFPEDSAWEKFIETGTCSAEEVVNILWREEWVPEWVNISVGAEFETYSLIKVVSCGRFTKNEKLLYHSWEGRPPFHVVGPILPVKYRNGEPFSIHNRSECWNFDELKYISTKNKKVWSLTLVGNQFNNEQLITLPTFPILEILELRRLPIEKLDLNFLENLPNLRILRITFDDSTIFDFRNLPTLKNLKDLTLRRISSEVIGIESLSEKMPMINSLSLFSNENWKMLKFPKMSTLQTLNIYYDSVVEGIDFRNLPNLKRLTLNGKAFNDNLCMIIFDQLPSLESIALRSRKIGNVTAEKLKGYQSLKSINFIGTSVTSEAIQSFRQECPEVRIFPRKRVDKNN